MTASYSLLEEPFPHITTHPLKIFDAARAQNRYLYALAPMVRYGKLAFRQTVYEYGVDLCWTPMMLAKEFNRNQFARDSDLTLSTTPPHHHRQPPTIVQFGANSPLELARASSLVAPFVSGVDLNCGCPQGWACAATLGAALMERRELVRDMVLETTARLRADGWMVGAQDRDVLESKRGRSVSVKIRVHKDIRKTIDFINTVIGDPNRRNIDFLTIHPRTRNTPSSIPIMAESLTLLTDMFGDTLPILLSGDIFAPGSLPAYTPSSSSSSSGSSVSSALQIPLETFTSNMDANSNSNSGTKTDTPTFPSGTKLAGVMSARGLLANPALFSSAPACPWDAVEVFMARVARAPLPLKLVLHHLTEMCGPGMGVDKGALLAKHERAALLELDTMCDVVDFMDRMVEDKVGTKGGMRRDAKGPRVVD